MIGAELLALALQVVGSTPTPSSQSAASAARPPACASANHRAFDFWVGDWEVFPFAGGVPVAKSKIERLYGGCGIRENWMPLQGGGGGSLNIYDTSDGKWHQTWIDSSGGRVEFVGGMEGDAMVLIGLWRGVLGQGKDGIVRMTYSRQPGGAVRQKGDVSTDGGKSWAPSFDYLYKPIA